MEQMGRLLGEVPKLPALARCGTYAGLGRGGVAAALLLLLAPVGVAAAAAVGTCERRRSTPLSLPPKTRAGGRTDGREKIFLRCIQYHQVDMIQ